MLSNHAKLMQFFAVAQEVTGRKKLQKMIYILQKCNIPFAEKYQFHHYGPYSEELTLRMEELCNLGFVEETKEDKKNFYQYHYQITGAGLAFLNQFTVKMPDMRRWVEQLNKKSSRFLELVATMMFFEDFPRDAVAEKVHTVKPKQKYTVDEIHDAWRFIGELREDAS